MTDDWTRRAEREAAALLAGLDATTLPITRNELVSALACAWLQGAIFAGHTDLAGLEVSFEQMQARL